MPSSLLLTCSQPARGSDRDCGRGWGRTDRTGHLLNMLHPSRRATYCNLPIYLGCRHLRCLAPLPPPSALPLLLQHLSSCLSPIFRMTKRAIVDFLPGTRCCNSSDGSRGGRIPWQIPLNQSSIHSSFRTHKAQWVREYLWQHRRQSCLSISSW